MLCFQECMDVDGYICLGQILSVQAAAGHAVSHIAAQLPVCGAGINIRSACPVAQRIDFRVRKIGSNFISRSVALANDQARAIKDVFPVIRILRN